MLTTSGIAKPKRGFVMKNVKVSTMKAASYLNIIAMNGIVKPMHW